MRRSLTVLMSIWLGVALGLGVAFPALAAKEARAERYVVDLVVGPGGALLVTERLRFAYTGGPFTWVTRDVPLARTDGVADVQAYLDGARLPPGDGPGQVEVTTGDSLHVTWHFAPLSDAVREFELRYRVLGVVRQGAGADELAWQALPLERDYQIETAEVTLTWPDALAPLTAPGASGAMVASEGAGTVARWTARSLAADESLLIEASFAPGSMLAAPPAWQASEQAAAARNAQTLPIAAGIALSILVLGGGLLFGLWQRQHVPATVGPQRRATPPGDLPPALAGYLASHGQVTADHALGTLFSLAQRNWLRISEMPRRNPLEAQDYTVELAAARGALGPIERALLAALFGPDAQPGASAQLGQRMTWLTQHWGEFSEPVQAEALAHDWAGPERQRSRRRLLAGSLALLGLAAALLLVAILWRDVWGLPALLVPLAVLIVAGVGAVFGSQISPLSERGRTESGHWAAFARYLREMAARKQPVAAPDLLERYLPYAAAFGLAAAWGKLSTRAGMPIAPSWFQSTTSGDDGFVAMLAATSVFASPDGGAASSSGDAGGGSSSTG